MTSRIQTPIGNGLSAAVGPPPRMDVLEQTKICDELKKQAGDNFQVVEIGFIDPENWMAMVALSNNESMRFRCCNGTIINESTVGN